MQHFIPPPVHSGQALEIHADFWNLLREMAYEYQRNRQTLRKADRRIWPGNRNEVTDLVARNASENDCPAFGFCRVSGIAGDPPLLDGGIPSDDDLVNDFLFRRGMEVTDDFSELKPGDQFAVAMDLIPAGEVGRVRVAGYAPVLAAFGHADDQTLGVLPSQTTFTPTTGVPGPAMVYRPPDVDAGDQFAVISLGPTWCRPMRYTNAALIAKDGGSGEVVLKYHERATDTLATWQTVTAWNWQSTDLEAAKAGWAGIDGAMVWNIMTEDCPA